MQQDRSTPSRSTDRGLSLVSAIADHPAGSPLADLARAVDLSASTALRQLRALETAGFASRGDDGRWVPGAELLRIATALAEPPLQRMALPVLHDIAELTGESTYLAEPVDADRAVYSVLAPGTFAVRHTSWLGSTVPRSGTAVGDALTGHVDDDGVALRHDAVEEGVCALSCPVRAVDGRIVAAVSVIGPSYRLAGERLTAARRALSGQTMRLHGTV